MIRVKLYIFLFQVSVVDRDDVTAVSCLPRSWLRERQGRGTFRIQSHGVWQQMTKLDQSHVTRTCLIWMEYVTEVMKMTIASHFDKFRDQWSHFFSGTKAPIGLKFKDHCLNFI